MPAGRLLAASCAAIFGSRPAFRAREWWANHSYCEVQWRAVMRMANSFRRCGREVLKRTYSPTACRRVARSGLYTKAVEGPRLRLAGGGPLVWPAAPAGPAPGRGPARLGRAG